MTLLLHSVRSTATLLASFQDCYPSRFLSCSTVLLRVVFGLPLLRLPSGCHLRAVTECDSCSIRNTWPIHLHLLAWISRLSCTEFVLCRISSFDTTYGQKIFRMYLMHLNMNVSTNRLSPSFIFQVSLPYSSTGFPRRLNILIFVLSNAISIGLISS